MIAHFINFIRTLIKGGNMLKKTHASITRGLITMVNDLNALTKANVSKAKDKTQQIATLTEDIRMLDMENSACRNSRPHRQRRTRADARLA